MSDVTSAAGYPKEKLDRLKARFSASIREIQVDHTDVPILHVPVAEVFDLLSALKVEEGFEFNFLADLTAYDHNPPMASIPDYNLGTVRAEGNDPRFFVVYQLLSLQNKERLRVKVGLKDGEEVPSVVPIWLAADWLEREVYDLYGIRFTGHPNLRRIMLDDRWEGHPLRKDYPMKRYQRFEDSLDMAAVGLEE